MLKLNSENEFMTYVENRLEHWARSCKTGNDTGLGFRSETVEYILMTVGIVVKSTQSAPLPFDEEAEEIEAIITDMGKYNDKMSTTLRLHYLGKGQVYQRAEKLGMSYARFRVYVDMARQWIAGRLSAHIHR